MSELMPIGSECEVLYAPSRQCSRSEWVLWRYRVVAHSIIKASEWDVGKPAERLEPISCDRVQATEARFTDDGGFEWIKPERFAHLPTNRVARDALSPPRRDERAMLDAAGRDEGAEGNP